MQRQRAPRSAGCTHGAAALTTSSLLMIRSIVFSLSHVLLFGVSLAWKAVIANSRIKFSMYCQLGSRCASWANCSNLSKFARAHLSTSSTNWFAKWRSVVAAASLALSKRLLPPRCPTALNRYRSRSTERRMWSGLLCSPVYPRQVFPSQQGFDGTNLAAQVDGLQSCAALQISPMCAPLSLRFSHGCCHHDRRVIRQGVPVEVSSENNGCASQKVCHCLCNLIPEVLLVLRRSVFLWCIPCQSGEIPVCLPVFHLGGSYLCTICPAPTVASRMAISTPHA